MSMFVSPIALQIYLSSKTKNIIRALNISLASHSKFQIYIYKKSSERTSTIQISFQYELYSLVSCTNIVHTLSILQENSSKNNFLTINEKKVKVLSVILKSL